MQSSSPPPPPATATAATTTTTTTTSYEIDYVPITHVDSLKKQRREKSN
jgi:hypothetical protein